jgi:hypothetical protein
MLYGHFLGIPGTDFFYDVEAIAETTRQSAMRRIGWRGNGLVYGSETLRFANNDARLSRHLDLRTSAFSLGTVTKELTLSQIETIRVRESGKQNTRLLFYSH